MIVQCPSCASKYRIRDANIPPAGGKIRCPSCSHSFVVYPEAPPEDNDRTSVTSRNEMDEILGQMQGGPPSEPEEDIAATQIASGELARFRTEQALRDEAMDPLDNDGTVEIQNPMEVWKEAQAAMEAARARSMDEVTLDEEDAATSVVDPAALEFARNPPMQQPIPPHPGDHHVVGPNGGFRDSSPGLGAAGVGSGMHPYAQNTPPQGSSSGPGQNGGGGLNSARLFEDSEVDDRTQPHGPAPSSAAPAASSADPNHPGPWKLKTSFGLTYEFADTKSLRSWLSNREELDGYELAAGDDVFHPLSSFPQLQRTSSRAMMPSGNFSMPPSHGSGLNHQVPPTPDASPPPRPGAGYPPEQSVPHRTVTGRKESTQRGPRVNTEFRPPSRESKTSLLLWPIFFLLLVVAVIVALHTFKVVDVVGFVNETILGKSPEVATQPVAQPVEEEGPDTVAIDPAALEQQQRLEAKRLLEDAERLIEGNKLPAARDKLVATQKLTPDEPAVYELLADVHVRLGNADEAARAEERAKELRALQEPAAAPDAGTSD